MRKQKSLFENIDWLLVVIYLVLILMGWLNIYAAVFNAEHRNIFDLSQSYGKQLIWISTSLLIALGIMIIDGKFYAAFSYPIYAFMMFMLLVVLVVARDVKGAVAWIDIGSFSSVERGNESDEIAIADPSFVEFFVISPGWTKEVAQKGGF